MTAPVRPLQQDTGKPLSRVLSLDEFNQAQSLPGSALKSAFGGTTPPDGRLSRVLSLDEFEQAQSMTGPAVKAMKIPMLPAPRDVTQTAQTSDRGPGVKQTGATGVIMRQLVNPMLENPFTTLGTTAALASPAGPVVGATMGLQMAYHVAQYGWQKLAESQLSPEDKARAEADPERISGEAAAVQAVMLGLGPLIHVGVKGYKSLDVSPGMMDAGAQGVKEAPLGPRFSPERVALDAAKHDYQQLRIAQDKADLQATPLSTLITGEDVSAARSADAQRVALAPRRRPAGAPAAYFESPQGAETLGAVAARHGLPGDANPYHPTTGLAEHWDAGHANATESFKNMSETGFAHVAGDEPSAVMLPAAGAGRAGSTVDAVARAKELVGPDKLRELADAEWARRGSPDTPESRMAAMEQVSRDVASQEPTKPTPSYPDGFAMGGLEGRIPGKSEVPKAARGSDMPVPEGVTAETAKLAAALTPSRFRGHSSDALASEALDAQTALEQAQANVEYARTRPLVGEAAQADMENRGVSYSDSQEGTSVTAEKQVRAAKARLAQIEREFSLRGVAGDALADVMQAAKEQRLEREGMSQEQALGKTANDFAGSGPGEEPRKAGALVPVEGTGALRPRGLSAAVERKALANKLTATVGDLPEYRAISMVEQSDRAVALLESDPALARRVALGEVPAPDGLLPESVFVAVENHAIEQGDVATIRDLATGKLTSEATTMGQRIRALGERDPDSPVGAIKKVIEVRMGGAKDVPRATEEVVAAIRAKLQGVDVTHDAWVKFVDSLRC